MRYKNHSAVSLQQSEHIQTCNQELNQNQNRNGLKISIFIFVIAILLVSAIYRYEEYEQVIYQIQHHPKKQDIRESQAAKILQNTQQQYNLPKQLSNKNQSKQNLLLFSNYNNQKPSLSQQNNDSLKQKQQSKENSSNLNQTLVHQTDYKQKQNNNDNSKQQTIYNLPILPELSIPQNQKRVTVVFTTCCSRYDLLQSTLNSFFNKNTFFQKLEQIIVVNDGQVNDQFNNLKIKWPNITWIVTQQKVGQIQAIDIAYSQVKTPFVFHAEDDWLFLRPNFIEVSFDYFERIPNLLQTWIKNSDRKINEKTRIVQSQNFGFSFNPGLKKMKHYQILTKGYKWITKNISHGTGAGKAQDLITRYYRKKGFIVAQTELNYIKHIGQERSLPKAST